VYNGTLLRICSYQGSRSPAGCLFLAAISYRRRHLTPFRRYSSYPPALLCDKLTRKPEQKDGIAKLSAFAETGRLFRLRVVGRGCGTASAETSEAEQQRRAAAASCALSQSLCRPATRRKGRRSNATRWTKTFHPPCTGELAHACVCRVYVFRLVIDSAKEKAREDKGSLTESWRALVARRIRYARSLLHRRYGEL
jgi:hypothetical protein